VHASRVDELKESVLRALEDGVSVARIAREAGLPEDTLRAWIRRGRRDREGRFGPFAEAFDRWRRPRLTVVGSEAPSSSDVPLPDRVELLRRLDEQSRNGSTRATELLLREIGAAPPAVDPFAELDTRVTGTPRRSWPADYTGRLPGRVAFRSVGAVRITQTFRPSEHAASRTRGGVLTFRGPSATGHIVPDSVILRATSRWQTGRN
jgi:transposase-like protein